MTSNTVCVVLSVTSKVSAPYASSNSSRMIDSSRTSVNNNRTTHSDNTNEMVEAGEVPCGAHTVNNYPQRRQQPRQEAQTCYRHAHIAATGPLRIKEICSAYDIPEEDDQPEHPYISFTVSEIYPTTAIAAEQSHKEETSPFGSLPASRPWSFAERAKPAICCEGLKKLIFRTCRGERTARANRSTVWPQWRQNRPRSSANRTRAAMLLPF